MGSKEAALLNHGLVFFELLAGGQHIGPAIPTGRLNLNDTKFTSG